MKKIIFLITLFILSFKYSDAQFIKLFEFNAYSDTTGSMPYGTLYFDGTFLYGINTSGGENDNGTIYKIKTDGSDFQILSDFPVYGNPLGYLISDGTFLYGAAGESGGYLTIYKIKKDGSNFTYLYEFPDSVMTHKSFPWGSLYYDGIFLYGVITNNGYPGGYKYIYKIKTDGSDFTKLLTFTDTIGDSPCGSLISDGNFLYGTTEDGGKYNWGTIYKIKKDGSGYIKLWDFNDNPYGQIVTGALISDDTYLYGMAGGGHYSNGIIYKIKTDGSDFNKIYEFTDSLNGCLPGGSLYYDGNFLYGITYECGFKKLGTAFKIKPDGSDFTKLCDYDSICGYNIFFSSFISDSTFLYGAATEGGIFNSGVLYKLSKFGSGINEIKEKNNILFYPNPASNNLTINISAFNNIPKNLQIYDIVGNVVIERTLKKSSNTIDISSLAKGIYFVKVTTGQGSVVKKFIKE